MWCSSYKYTFTGAGNLQMITNKLWYEYFYGPYVLSLDPDLCIVLVSLEVEAYNFRSWLHEKKTSLLTRLVYAPRQILAWYYIKFLNLWRGD